MELQPSNPRFYSERGWAFFQNKAYEQARVDYTHAIRLDATYKSAYFGRGYVYLWLKEGKLAHADFVQYADRTPKSINAAWMVIYSSFGKQRPGSEVIEALEKLAATGPQSSSAQLCRGVALGLGHKYDEGIVQLEQAIQLERSTQDAYFWKGVFCAYLEQSADATQAIMQALEAELPPALLIPLYWLEQERPEMYRKIAVPFLTHYEV